MTLYHNSELYIFLQYAPHFSTFVPVYASAPVAPSSLNRGTQYKLDKQSNWWIHCLLGNYVSRWYVHTIDDVRLFQAAQEVRDCVHVYVCKFMNVYECVYALLCMYLYVFFGEIKMNYFSFIFIYTYRQTSLHASLDATESRAAKAVRAGDSAAAKDILQSFQEEAATSTRDAWYVHACLYVLICIYVYL